MHAKFPPKQLRRRGTERYMSQQCLLAAILSIYGLPRPKVFPIHVGPTFSVCLVGESWILGVG